MTQVPASSHGGGSTFNGGTITTPLAIEPTVNSDALTIQLPAGSHSNGITIGDTDSGKTVLAVDAGGDFVFQSGSGAAEAIVRSADAASEFRLNTGTSFQYTVASVVKFRVLASGALTCGIVSCADVTSSGGGSFTNVGCNTISTSPITSGALPTVAPVSAMAFQTTNARDTFLVVPVTYNPGVATVATCKVELSPDNTTFSTLVTVTKPVGTVFDGSIDPVELHVPAGWWVKLTVTNATLGTGTYY